VAFLLIHVALALIVPKTIVAMVDGGPPEPDDRGQAKPMLTPAE